MKSNLNKTASVPNLKDYLKLKPNRIEYTFDQYKEMNVDSSDLMNKKEFETITSSLTRWKEIIKSISLSSTSSSTSPNDNNNNNNNNDSSSTAIKSWDSNSVESNDSAFYSDDKTSLSTSIRKDSESTILKLKYQLAVQMNKESQLEKILKEKDSQIDQLNEQLFNLNLSSDDNNTFNNGTTESNDGNLVKKYKDKFEKLNDIYKLKLATSRNRIQCLCDDIEQLKTKIILKDNKINEVTK
jgi:hypothetical protein